MIQIGTGDITYDDLTIVHDTGDKHLIHRLSAQIHADTVQSDLFKKLKDDPHDYHAGPRC